MHALRGAFARDGPVVKGLHAPQPKQAKAAGQSSGPKQVGRTHRAQTRSDGVIMTGWIQHMVAPRRTEA